MPEYQVVDVPREQNLDEFSAYLWRQKIPHRLVVIDDRQVVLVGQLEHARQVAAVWPQFAQGERPALDVISNAPSGGLRRWLTRVRRVPVTVLVTFACVLLFFWMRIDTDVLHLLTFATFDSAGEFAPVTFANGDYWRLLTPIFIHANLMHIVFNLLWLVYFGSRIESAHGSTSLLALVVVCGVGSNIIQYKYSGIAAFGGMSGVVYGLMGYASVWNMLVPTRPLPVPLALVVAMLVFMVLFMFGFAVLLGQGPVANAAHLGGLVIGAIIGLGFGLSERRSTSSP